MTNPPQIEVAEHALAVLAASLGDYTDPDEEGHRARVVVVGGSTSDGFFDVEVLRPSGRRAPRFRVSVVVQVLPVPALVALDMADEASIRGGVSARDESGVVRPMPWTGNWT